MRIDGKWRVCDDEILRPMLRAWIRAADGSWVRVRLLVDTGADCTAFSADVLEALNLPVLADQAHLGGIGGAADSVVVQTHLQLRCDDGRAATFRGSFAAFTSPQSADLSVLGRDILASFAVIVDQPGDVVCLIGQRHRYVIQAG
jgi:predicted aspartyl protease